MVAVSTKSLDLSACPTTMTAIEIRSPGPGGELRSVTRPLPHPRPEEVLIRVTAAGVNRPDCLQRRGLYPPPPGASDLPGLEVSGRIAAIGSAVTGWRVGDRACALLAGGGYAEYVTAPAAHCLPVPSTVNMTEAAALPETYFTVWANLFERGALCSGETVLVHGGASGIGTTAIQLARNFGARVFATAGSDEKVALCKRIGAEQAANYHKTDFADFVDALTGGRGVDVIVDIVGGDYFERNLRLLADDGRLVVIGLLGGTASTIDLGRLLTRRLTVTGSTLRARPAEDKTQIALALREWVWPRLGRGQCLPVIHTTLPLAEAARAHRMLEANEAMGKIVLTVSD